MFNQKGSAKKKNYFLTIELYIANKWGIVGYFLSFILCLLLLMTVIDFILYAFLDNYKLLKDVLDGIMSVGSWFALMLKTYTFQLYKILLWALIFIYLAYIRWRAYLRYKEQNNTKNEIQ